VREDPSNLGIAVAPAEGRRPMIDLGYKIRLASSTRRYPIWMNVPICIAVSNETPQRSADRVLWAVGMLYCQNTKTFPVCTHLDSLPHAWALKRNRHIPVAPHMSSLRIATAQRRPSESSLPSFLPRPAADVIEIRGYHRVKTYDRSRSDARQPLAFFRIKSNHLAIVERRL
jgi:hypothetical protein